MRSKAGPPAARNSGYERIVSSRAAEMLDMREWDFTKFVSGLPRTAGMTPRNEPRGVTYDAAAVERLVRRRKIPTQGRAGSPDWLTQYQERKTR